MITFSRFLFPFFFCISFNIHSQEKVSTWLTLTYNGFEDKVFEVPNNSAAELYSKAKTWAQIFYPNLERELIYDSLNYKFKIRTLRPEAFYTNLKRNQFDVDYTLILSFKDNKYRIQVELNKFYYNPRNVQYRGNGESQETGWDQRKFYLAEKEMDPKMNLAHSELTYVLFDVSNSLYTEIISASKSESEEDNTDDW